jgi:hypothetical protein
VSDRAAFAKSHELSEQQAAALIAMDEDLLRDGFQQNPLLTSGAVRRLTLLKSR